MVYLSVSIDFNFKNEGKVFIKTPAIGGDEGGECWDERQQGEVRQLFIYHGDSIDSIQTACGSDSVELSDKHGGHGKKFNVVRGHYGHHCGRGWEPVVVRSLTFETDDGSVYGPFGTEADKDFSFHLDGARFGGFHGRSCDDFLRAIGIYVDTDATGTTYAGSNKLQLVGWEFGSKSNADTDDSEKALAEEIVL
ncbi:hypothetical protein ACLOJK_026513 [Asimina triloba]